MRDEKRLMQKELKILLLEDSKEDAVLIQRELAKAGFRLIPHIVDTKEEFEAALKSLDPDVILSDHSLPEFNSVEALKVYQKLKAEKQLSAPFILVTGSVSEEFAVECIKNGAADYILKDRLRRLPSAISSALERAREIEEKRRSENEQKRLLEIIRKSINEIYIFNADTLLFEYMNDGALQNLGYRQTEALQLTPLDLMPAFSEKLFKDTLRNIDANSSRKIIFEAVHCRKNGTRYPVEVHLQLIEQGSKKSFLAVAIDITHRKQIETERELVYRISKIFCSEKSLEDDLTSSLAEICRQYTIHAAEAWVTSIDKMYLKLAGAYAANGQLEFFGEKVFFLKGEGLVGTAWRTKNPVFVRDIQSDGRYMRTKFAKANGLYSVLAVPVIFHNEVTAVLTFYSCQPKDDATEIVVVGNNLLSQLASDIRRKKTEVELHNFFTHSPDIICILGTDGYVKKINPVASAMLGYRKEDFLSRPYISFVDPEDHELTLREIGRFNNDGTPNYFENRLLASNGEGKWVAWTAIPIEQESLVYAVGKDITEKKAAEQKLHLLHEELSLAKLKKQQEITSTAIAAQEAERQEIGRELHDNINQLLASSRLYISMARTQQGEQKTFLRKAEELVNSAINEIRNLSHSLIVPSLHDESFATVVQGLAEEVAQTSGTNIHCYVQLDDEEKLSDKLKLNLYRIVQEQLHNIMKYAKASHIEVAIVQEDQQLLLRISDNGIGFDPSKKPKGVGFLNMQTRLSLFNGEMKVISSPGNGCELEISVVL